MSMLYLLLSMFTLPALDYVLTVPVQISLCPYSCSLLCLLLFRSEPVMSLLYLLLTMSLLFLHLTMSLFFLLLNGPLFLPLICFVFTLPVQSWLYPYSSSSELVMSLLFQFRAGYVLALPIQSWLCPYSSSS